jgi:hypothetical protein
MYFDFFLLSFDWNMIDFSCIICCFSVLKCKIRRNPCDYQFWYGLNFCKVFKCFSSNCIKFRMQGVCFNVSCFNVAIFLCQKSIFLGLGHSIRWNHYQLVCKICWFEVLICLHSFNGCVFLHMLLHFYYQNRVFFCLFRSFH